MNRRQFCQKGTAAIAWTLWSPHSRAETDLVTAALGGRTLVQDHTQHYPHHEGVVDLNNGHRFFFHAHRTGELGHFHTFSVDQYRAPIHVAMISIDRSGKPILISTTNQWVTGTRYLDAEAMLEHIHGFGLEPSTYKHPSLVRFVNEQVRDHADVLSQLYKERDVWLAKYRATHESDPFKDTSHEILSSRAIEGAG